jgi:hypothetical protein
MLTHQQSGRISRDMQIAERTDQALVFTRASRTARTLQSLLAFGFLICGCAFVYVGAKIFGEVLLARIDLAIALFGILFTGGGLLFLSIGVWLLPIAILPFRLELIREPLTVQYRWNRWVLRRRVFGAVTAVVLEPAWSRYVWPFAISLRCTDGTRKYILRSHAEYRSEVQALQAGRLLAPEIAQFLDLPVELHGWTDAAVHWEVESSRV